MLKFIEEAEAQFDHPLKQCFLFKEFEEKVEARALAELPEQVTRSRQAQAFYGVLKQTLPEAFAVAGSASGVLTMNTYLIKAPRLCIDYVIQHGLCHLVERNHGTRFYRMLDRVCPERKVTKERLDRLAPALL